MVISFSSILPEPGVKWNIYGEENASTGNVGPGFASIKLKSVQPLIRSMYNSQRIERDVGSYHKWEVDISYHPMTRAEFDAVSSFLEYKQNTMTPFYVSIPQYTGQNPTGKQSRFITPKGSTTLLVDSGTNDILPGMIFSFAISTKVYKVVRVETSAEYYDPAGDSSGDPGAGIERLHIVPGLAEEVVNNILLDFSTAMIYVVQSGETIEYSLGQNNLYSFSAKFEEVSV